MSDSNDVRAAGDRSVAAGTITSSAVLTGDFHLHSGLTLEQVMQIIAAVQRAYETGRAVARGNLADDQLEITAPDLAPIIITPALADDLRQIAVRHGDEPSYLAALCVNPRYKRWAKQFVPLAGTLTSFEPPPDIPLEIWLLEIQREGGARQVQRTRLDDVRDALAKHATLVLLGAPGSGKTTTLQKLAFDEATQRLSGASARVPLFLPLSDYRGYATPLEFVHAHWGFARGNADLSDALARGQLLLLVDALNEMPFDDDKDYRAKVEAWREFGSAYPGNQILFTCRSRDYSDKLGLHEVEIEKLDSVRIREFLAKYVPEWADSAWQKIESSPLLELVSNPYYLSILAYLIKMRAEFPANRADLFESFVAHRLNFESAKHPDWLGDEAMRAALAGLAESLQPMGETTSLPRPEITSRVPVQVDTARGVVTTPPQKVIAFGIAATLLDVEMQKEIEKVRFYHHQLQEYFAARALLKRWRAGEDVSARWKMPRLQTEMPDPGKLGDFEPLPPPPTTKWEEPTILAAGLCQDPRAFLDAVRAVNPVLAARCLTESGVAIPDDAKKQTQDALLGEMSDLRVHLRYRIAAGDALGNLGDPRFQEMDANGTRILLPPFVEIPAGTFKMGTGVLEAVGLLARGFLPVQLELPRHTVDVPSFYIAQYPVTNAEYACFIHAGGYANGAYWKTEAARAWRRGEGESGALKQYLQIWQAIQNPKQLAALERMVSSAQANQLDQIAKMSEDEVRAFFKKDLSDRRRDQPAYWDDTSANNLAQPVVGINWFEANAYCAWMTEQFQISDIRLQIEKQLGLGPKSEIKNLKLEIRLPTEAEWEKAARGTRGWKYPWGNQWDAHRANTDESHTIRATPVGIYPNGATPEKAYDLAGNVGEWTSTMYHKYPYQKDDRENPEGEDARVVRGGSFGYTSRLSRCAYRLLGFPGDLLRYLGLRVVLSPIRLWTLDSLDSGALER
jgi:formylglycine-generating enzyme required for sulfatase activity